MKKTFMLVLLTAGILGLQSCTADSIQEIEAEMEAYATDNTQDPNNPKELPIGEEDD